MGVRLNKKAVIVLSAGRSGTSLLMQVLQAIGLRLSENLLQSQWSNPDGFFEDVDIVELHKDLLKQLGANQNLPLPLEWKDHAAINKFKNSIRVLLELQLSKDNCLWGFKDPRTCSFLPVWFEVMQSLWVTPVFILAIRKPEAAIPSMVRQAPAMSTEIAELIWLTRTCDALQNTFGVCFIVHYEDWFSEPIRLSEGLTKHIGFTDEYCENIKERLQEIIKPAFNRSSRENYIIKNSLVSELYAALNECHGADFDRQRLMTVVKECRHVMDGFKGWYQLAHQANKKLADTQTRLEQVKIEAAKVKDLESRIRVLEQQKMRQDQLGTHIHKLERQLEHLMMLKH